MTICSSHILEELYQTAWNLYPDRQRENLLKNYLDKELNERCKRYIAIKQRIRKSALLVLEDKLNTDNLQLMPDGTIHEHDHLDNTRDGAKILSDAHILVTGLHISGDTLKIIS